jgi:hypothetical protein
MTIALLCQPVPGEQPSFNQHMTRVFVEGLGRAAKPGAEPAEGGGQAERGVAAVLSGPATSAAPRASSLPWPNRSAEAGRQRYQPFGRAPAVSRCLGARGQRTYGMSIFVECL